MPEIVEKTSKRVLEPHERISEVVFGLIMVLTFTGSLSVAEAGRSEIRVRLIGALTMALGGKNMVLPRCLYRLWITMLTGEQFDRTWRPAPRLAGIEWLAALLAPGKNGIFFRYPMSANSAFRSHTFNPFFKVPSL